MDEIQVGPWRIAYDRAATVRAYEGVPKGWAEVCGCQSCRNFIAARYQIYSLSMLDLLRTLGIDPEKEAEAVDWGFNPDKPGTYVGNSWFHVVGHVVDGPAEPEHGFVQPQEDTGVTFSRGLGLVPDSFGGRSVVQVEWFGDIPWVLDEPRENSYR